MFVDVDNGDTLTLSATRADGSALPAWLSFNVTTRTFSGTPTNQDIIDLGGGDSAYLAVTLTATDAAGATANQYVSFAIANTNDAPIVANPIADQQATLVADEEVGAQVVNVAARADRVAGGLTPIGEWTSNS